MQFAYLCCLSVFLQENTGSIEQDLLVCHLPHLEVYVCVGVCVCVWVGMCVYGACLVVRSVYGVCVMVRSMCVCLYVGVCVYRCVCFMVRSPCVCVAVCVYCCVRVCVVVRSVHVCMSGCVYMVSVYVFVGMYIMQVSLAGDGFWTTVSAFRFHKPWLDTHPEE